MPHRIDWQAVKALYSEDEYVLTVLPKRFIALLHSSTYDLGWRATFRIKGYDFSDWDELQRLISEGLDGLNDMARLTDLFAYLEQILDAIGAIDPCCGQVQYGVPPDYSLDETGDVPQSVIDAGYATDVTDWTGYTDYKCMAAHVMVNTVQQTLEEWANMLEGPGKTIFVISALLASLWLTWITAGAGAVIVIAGLSVDALAIWGVWEALLEWTPSTLRTLAGDVDDARSDLVCAMYFGDGLDDIKTDLDAAYDTLFSTAEATILKLASTKARIAALFAGHYGDKDAAQALADLGADVADYSCDCSGPVIAKVIEVHSFTGLSSGDIVHDGDELAFSVNEPTEHYCALVLGDETSGPWDVTGKHLRFTLVSQTGWSNSTNWDLVGYDHTSTPPYYWQSDTQEKSWASPPLVIYNTHGKIGFQLQSGSAWSGVVRVEILDD